MKDLEARQEETLRLDRDALIALCHRVLTHHNFTEEQASALGGTLVAAQLDASHSHGIYRLLGIIDTVKKGGAVTDAVPEVEDVAPGVVRVDAKGGFSPCAFERGMPHLVAKAREAGVALLAINHCVHSTALWVELEDWPNRDWWRLPATLRRLMWRLMVANSRCWGPIPLHSAGLIPATRRSSLTLPPAPSHEVTSSFIDGRKG